ncbi:MAG: DUF1559 domain-containing protein [Capsulimonadaceae bacterium]|nr:DUF1559 domain-containing protein [Capsulimonadaceae bacterium]
MKKRDKAPHASVPPSGFTLIELLIVIAIIAILAAILFPVFATAREKARQTACLSNLKQIGLAYTQYEQDYDETCPNGSDPWGSGQGWAGQIYPYIKSTQVFLCPDDTGAGDICSYAVNDNIVPAPPGASSTTIPVAWPLSRFSSPARTVLLCEVINSTTNVWPNYTIPVDTTANNGRGCSPAGNGYGSYVTGCNQGAGAGYVQYVTGYLNLSQSAGQNNGNESAYYSAAGRHSGGSCYLLADNHVKWMMSTLVASGIDNQYSGSCGVNSLAANTGCSSVAATFSLL